MSYASWNQSKTGGENFGKVTARMETMPSFGMPSISVSQQQAPKKFAPVVAPKPKFNPYKQLGEGNQSEGDFPPPPPLMDEFSHIPFPTGSLPPPPTDGAACSTEVKIPEKTLDERRSSLDAEIDSLTSILADLENSSPYKPRTQQSFGGPGITSPTASTPVTGHKRMVIPTQPPLTATKKSATKPQPQVPATTTASGPKPQSQSQLQPVPASYTTAFTPGRPTYNVQVRPAQPTPQYTPPIPQPALGLSPSYNQQYPQQRSPGTGQHITNQPRAPDFAYGPQQPVRQQDPASFYAPPPPKSHVDPHYVAGPVQGSYGASNTWRPEMSYATSNTGNSGYQPPAPKKTYITDSPLLSMVPTQQQGSTTGPKSGFQASVPSMGTPTPGNSGSRPEDELELLTKKMLYDMDNPPTEEYFGRCSRCGENVVGEGTGCTAMDQVFHVDCFTCMTCSRKLRGQPFYAVEKKAFCEPCYINTLEQCFICMKPIMERILRATGKAYHPHCFTCVECHRSLDGIPFTVDANNQIHCIEDFHRKFAPRCSVCKEPIMPAEGQEETVRIVALDRDFHVQCYRCEDCGVLLSEGDHQGCYPLDGHILCKTCNTSRIQALTAKATTDL
ncbi:lipoma-preferred partner [Erpetoichthys calabaricus]|uniref:lipoma-preferred partner n=1 Tax=Erpetoichthys calabaricus TaxID=27687 RepID=UPI002234E35F|nr:lipoma-preferred partner [Erpetoichthys calabaricus]XP_051778198.1 lipoma-preferred partner [Erpetoichthys calabaricus]